MENLDEKKYKRAKKKVEKLKAFYIHLFMYLIFNTFISGKKIMNDIEDGDTFVETFFDFSTFAVWLFWGIGIFFHGLDVFGFGSFFGKDWEKRKMDQFMKEEETKRKKYDRHNY